MTRRVVAILTLLLSTAPCAAGGFDRAIESATARAVKLYGLGAGIQEGYGTGVLVSADGLVLTVNSLLIDGRNLYAVTSDGARYEFEVVHRDEPTQLALLRLRPPRTYDTQGREVPVEAALGPFPYFDLDGDAAVAAGEWVITAGNAFRVATGAEPVSIAHGICSVRTRLDARRRVSDFPYTGDVLVIDAISSNPGAPGSALVNLDGELVGLIGRTVVSNLTHTHLNYAVPRDVLQHFVQEALDPQREAAVESTVAAAATDFGIRMMKTGYQNTLPFVERVALGSAAARAGLKRDDLVLAVNGRDVATLADYERRMALVRPGEPVELVVRRDRKILTIRIEPEGS